MEACFATFSILPSSLFYRDTENNEQKIMEQTFNSLQIVVVSKEY